MGASKYWILDIGTTTATGSHHLTHAVVQASQLTVRHRQEWMYDTASAAARYTLRVSGPPSS